VKLRVLEIARAARSKAPQSQEKLKKAYGQLLDSTGRVMGQAKRFSREIAEDVKRSADILQPSVMGANWRSSILVACSGSCDMTTSPLR
jgi:IS5 family transposase